MRFILFVIRFFLLLGLLGFALAALAAFLGFAVPLFDMFNHFQPVWLTGLVIMLILGLLFFRRQPGRGAVMAIGFSGLLASAIIVIPELLAGWSALPPVPADTVTYKIMSRNLFGLNYDMKRVAEAVADEDPDIIALQEYFSEQRDGLHDRLIGTYPHFAECTGGRRASIAIFSKLPFEISDDSFCPDNIGWEDNRIAWLEAKFAPDGEAPFTVMTTHLNWPIQISPLRDTSLSWPERIAAMSARKASEYDQLSAELSKIDGPLLLLGDFNATPWSYELRHFATANELTRRTHNLFTYPARFYLRGWQDTPPFLPLDHLLTRGGVAVHSVAATSPAGSDHKALLAQFSVGEP